MQGALSAGGQGNRLHSDKEHGPTGWPADDGSGHAGGRAWRTARQSRAQSGHVGTRRRGMMGHRPMEPSAQPNVKENTKAGIRSKTRPHTAVSQ